MQTGTLLYRDLYPKIEATRFFGLSFEPPYIFGAESHRPVSCYALFKGMAASKPTSWVYKRFHILCHLSLIWDLRRRSGLFPLRHVALSCHGLTPLKFTKVFEVYLGLVGMVYPLA